MPLFQEWWLHDKDLKRWIIRVENCQKHIYCRFCCKLLTAHTSHINAHAKVIAHQLVEAKYEACDSNCPYFEKITVSIGETGEAVVKKLNDWLFKGGVQKTFCVHCNKQICAYPACRVLHSKTTAHRLNIPTPMNPSVSNVDNRNECYDRAHQLLDFEDAIGDSTAGCSGMDYEANNLSLVPSGTQDLEDSPMLSAIPMSCETREDYDPPTKRQKMDTQFVLNAIRNGYFDKEDLRQIARGAVDKLSE